MSLPAPPPSSAQLYRRLLGYVAPHWKVIVISMLAMTVAAGSEAAFAWLMQPLIDGNFLKPGDAYGAARQMASWPDWLRPIIEGLSHWAGEHLGALNESRNVFVPVAIVVLFLIRGVSSFVGDYCSAWLSNRLAMELRQRMFDRLITLPSRFYENHPSGSLMSKVVYDSGNVMQAVFSVISVSVKDGLGILLQLATMLYIDWQLTLVCFATIPLAAVSIRYAGKRLRGISRGAQQAVGEVNQVLQEAIEGQRVVKVFGGQQYETNRFFDRTNRLRLLGVKSTAASSANQGLVQILASIALGFMIYYAGLRAASGVLTAGKFMTFIFAMMFIMPALKRINGVSDAFQRGMAAAESVFALIDAEPEDDRGTVELGRARGAVELRNVSFQYPTAERPALNRINLSVQPGETIALVGSSGSGKTTLVGLLPRFYHVGSGEILIDGAPIEDIRLTSLRGNISLVSQEVVLFNDSVADNIAYGRDEISREKVIEAAEAAYAKDFIEQLPQGFDTLIGEKGARLSGGQRQRLAIARALLKDAPILILDEATSALDTQSERQVQAALERLMQNRTTFVIAHRLSTIENADRIVVMNHGEIVEVGTHAELISKGGHYALLHQMQFREPEAALADEKAPQ